MVVIVRCWFLAGCSFAYVVNHHELRHLVGPLLNHGGIPLSFRSGCEFTLSIDTSIAHCVTAGCLSHHTKTWSKYVLELENILTKHEKIKMMLVFHVLWHWLIFATVCCKHGVQQGFAWNCFLHWFTLMSCLYLNP